MSEAQFSNRSSLLICTGTQDGADGGSLLECSGKFAGFAGLGTISRLGFAVPNVGELTHNA